MPEFLARQLYGLYSKKQEDRLGYCIYQRIDGTEVRVTQVTSNVDDHGSCFDDVQFVGEVSKYISSHPTPAFLEQMNNILRKSRE